MYGLLLVIPVLASGLPEPPDAPPSAVDGPASEDEVVPPVLLEAPAPTPTAEGGTVVLLLLIDEQGGVEEVEPVSGDPALIEAATALARQARFAPAREAGAPVAVQMEWAVSFPALAPPPPAEAPEQPPVAPPEDEGLVATFYHPVGAPLVRSLTKEQIEAMPGTLGDPVRAVANMPGVERTPLEAGWLLVRGGGPTETGLFVDGIRVPLVYHMGGLTSAINPGFIQDIAFIPSGQPARYGDALSGVLDLRTAAQDGPAHATARVDTVASGLFITTPISKKHHRQLSLAFRRSYLDALLALVPGVTEQQASIAPRFWDWGARLDWDDLGLFAFGYDDSITAPTSDDGETVELHMGTARVHGRATLHPWGDRLELTPYVAREWSTVDALAVADHRLSNRGGTRIERPDSGEGPWGWTAGVEGELGRWDMIVNDVAVGGLFGSADPYASLRLGHTPSLTLGARADTLFLPGQLPRAAPSGRLGLSVPLDPRWALVGDLGLYHTAPDFDVLLGLPSGAYAPLQRAWGGGVGGRLERGGLSADLDLWGRAMDRLAVFEDDNSLGQGRGVAYGLESLVSLTHGPLASRTCLTLSRSLRQNEPGHPWEPYTFDQPVVASTVFAWEPKAGLTLAARFRYASGYPRDPEIDSAYDILTAESRSLEAWPDRLPAFHALDLKVTRVWDLRHWRFEAYLDVQNVYSRRIAEPAITGIIYQPIFYTYGLPILPIFGLEGTLRGG